MKARELIELLQANPEAEVTVKGFIDPESTFGKNIAATQGLKRWQVKTRTGFRRDPDFYGPVYLVQATPSTIVLNAGQEV